MALNPKALVQGLFFASQARAKPLQSMSELQMHLKGILLETVYLGIHHSSARIIQTLIIQTWNIKDNYLSSEELFFSFRKRLLNGKYDPCGAIIH